MDANRDKSRLEDVPGRRHPKSGQAIYGKPVDDQTRCEHYHSDVDIIALKFKCCDRYFPCFSCHEETAGHAAQVWDKGEEETEAILCGVCGGEFTIREYLTGGYQCPKCHASFNPRCSNHYPLYFSHSLLSGFNLS